MSNARIKLEYRSKYLSLRHEFDRRSHEEEEEEEEEKEEEEEEEEEEKSNPERTTTKCVVDGTRIASTL